MEVSPRSTMLDTVDNVDTVYTVDTVDTVGTVQTVDTEEFVSWMDGGTGTDMYIVQMGHTP